MKRFIISFILVFALTGHAYGMGWFDSGHHGSDRGTVVTTGGDPKGGTSGTTGIDGGNPWINNGSSDCNTHAVPEPLTLLLLGSGLIGLVALRKKFKN